MELKASETGIDISIIVLSYNTSQLTRDCINSIYNTTKKVSFEIICIDDNSRDGSPELIEEEFPYVKLIRNKKNLVYAKSNNIGMRLAKGRYVCLLNSDVCILNGVFDYLVEFLDENPDAGAASPKILNPDHTVQFCVRSLPSLWVGLCQSIGLHKVFPKNRTTEQYYNQDLNYNEVFKADSIGTTCFVVRREILETVGYLDERFPLHCVDLDYNKRIRDKGYNIYFVSDVQIIHYGGQSINQENYKQLKEQHLAIYLMYKKHYAPNKFVLTNGAVYIGIFLRYLSKIIITFFSKDKRVVKGPGAPKI